MIDRKYLGGHCHKHRLIVTAENKTKQGGETKRQQKEKIEKGSGTREGGKTGAKT